MKVRSSVRPMYKKCKITECKDKVMVICENPKYRQEQSQQEVLKQYGMYY